MFYNGRDKQPDEQILRLSDAFKSDNPNPVLECRARMININLGHNQELMEGCKWLWDYSYFIAEINQYLDKGYGLETAVKKAMNECIEDLVKAAKDAEYQEKLCKEYNL